MNVFVYLLSSFFMFFIGNMQEWLKPLLMEHGAPIWVYNSFSFYAIIFVAAGLLNTLIIKSLSPKSVDEKELKTLRNKQKNNDKDKRNAINKVTEGKEKEKNNEIKKLNLEHQRQNKDKDRLHKDEISRLEATIKIKDSFIESMTQQLTEKFMVINAYNQESNTNKNTPMDDREHMKTTKGIFPDISDYTN